MTPTPHHPRFRIAASSVAAFLALGVAAVAGSLTPSALPASTMHSLEELYDSIAGTFDSSSVVSSSSGSLIEHLKFIEENMVQTGVASDALDFDEFVDSMTLDADFTVASSGFETTWNGNTSFMQGNVGIATSSPDSLLEVAGGNITHLFRSAPTQTSVITTATQPSGIDVAGNVAYVGHLGSGGVKVYDLSNPASPSLMTTITTAGTGVSWLQAVGHLLYVADSNALRIFDVAKPASASQVGSVPMGAAIYVTVNGGYAYVSDYGSGVLKVVDVRNPANPQTVFSSNFLSSSPYQLFVSGNLLFAGRNNFGWQIWDISNPKVPTFLSAADPGQNRAVYSSGRYFFTGGDFGLQIYDITSPTAPTLVYSDASQGVYRLSGAGRYLYVATGGTDLDVYDISNPAAPVLVSTFTGTSIGYLKPVGRYGYALDYGGQFRVLDLNGLETPAFSTGSVYTGSLNVVDNAVLGSLNIRSGLNIGSLGFLSEGQGFVNAAASASAFSIVQRGRGPILEAYDGTTPAFVINDGGNAGFGIASPSISVRLEVAGEVSVSHNVLIDATRLYPGTTSGSLKFNTQTFGTTSWNGGALTLPRYGISYALASGEGSLSSFQSAYGGFRFYTGNTNTVADRLAMVITNAGTSPGTGNVGINSIAPEQKLEVGGSILASTSGNADLILNSTGDNDAVFTLRSVNSAGRLAVLSSASSELFSVTASGNVGIGTTPARRLDIVSYDNATGSIVRVRSNNLSQGVGIGFQSIQQMTSGFPLILNASGSGQMQIGNVSTGDVLIAQGGGNVGIGATATNARLNVSGTASVSSNLGVWSGGNPKFYVSAASGRVGINTNNLSEALEVAGTASISGLLNLGAGASVSGSLIPTSNDVWSLGSSTLRWKDLYVASGSLHIGTNGDEAVIDYDVASDFLAFKPNGTTNGMVIADSGFVGIGEQNSAADILGFSSLRLGITGGTNRLAFEDSGSSAFWFVSGNSGGTNAWLSATATDVAVGAYTNTPVRLTSNNVARVYVATSGNVGIGNEVSTPDQVLDVRGNILASTSGNVDLILKSTSATGDEGRFTIRSGSTSERFDVINGAGAKLFTLSSTGYATIGTADPVLDGSSAAFLTVVGSNSCCGALTLRNTGGLADLHLDSAAFGGGTPGIGAQLSRLTFNGNAVTNNAMITARTDTNAADTGVLTFHTKETGGGILRRMLIDSTGNVGIGTDAPEAVLEVNTGATGAIIASGSVPSLILHNTNGTGANEGRFWIRSNDTERLDFASGTLAVVRMSIASVGYVGINTSAPARLLHIASSGDGDLLRLQDSDGTCDLNPEAGGVTESCSSDERLKRDIEDAPSMLAYLDDFRIREYTMRSSGDRLIGVIAQELRETHPDLVTMGPNGLLMVQTPGTWQLIKAIQELSGRIDSLGSSGPLNFSDSDSWFSSLFSSIIAAFENLLGIEFGEGEVRTERLCAGDVCVNEQQLRQLLEVVGGEVPDETESSDGPADEPAPTEEPSTDGDEQSDEGAPEEPAGAPEEETPDTGEGVGEESGEEASSGSEGTSDASGGQESTVSASE